MSLKLEDFVSKSGECVGVDYSESEVVDPLYTLEGYHPKSCDLNESYSATKQTGKTNRDRRFLKAEILLILAIFVFYSEN